MTGHCYVIFFCILFHLFDLQQKTVKNQAVQSENISQVIHDFYEVYTVRTLLLYRVFFTFYGYFL